MDFHDKVCVITGGANGIGRFIAEEFLGSGAKVACIDIDHEAGQALLSRFNHNKLFFFHGDIGRKAILEEFAANVMERYQGVDYLINNACIGKKGILSDCSYEDFEYVLRIGVAAPFYLTRLFMNAFKAGAAIVNISSTRAFMSQADTESYSSAKGGINALTHALSISLAGKVRVNAISPGWIDTSAFHLNQTLPEHSDADKTQHPAGRIGAPADIASMALFLCSEQAGFITGENIIIDGGMTSQMIYHNDDGWFFSPQK